MTDFNKLAKLEQAIKEKYGEEAIMMPNADLSPEQYQKLLKGLEKLQNKIINSEHKDFGGFSVSAKLLNKENRTCLVCKTYSFKSDDDVFMIKFGCCEKCFIKWVEGREERWFKGWRPNENYKKEA